MVFKFNNNFTSVNILIKGDNILTKSSTIFSTLLNLWIASDIIHIVTEKTGLIIIPNIFFIDASPLNDVTNDEHEESNEILRTNEGET